LVPTVSEQKHNCMKKRDDVSMDTDRGGSRCKGRTKQGKPCRAAATEGGLCFLHANPNKASELGRIGGRKNRHVLEGAARPLPPLDTIQGVRTAIGQMIIDVHERRLDPRTAAGVAPLVNALLRALGAAELEQRIKNLEEQIERLQVTASPDPADDEDEGEEVHVPN
jgi:hypothetical protein